MREPRAPSPTADADGTAAERPPRTAGAKPHIRVLTGATGQGLFHVSRGSSEGPSRENAAPHATVRHRAPRSASPRERRTAARAGEVRVGQTRAGEVRADETRAGETRAGEVTARTTEPLFPYDTCAPIPDHPAQAVETAKKVG
ncbi:hypothetical protein [Streptomyces corynorhini]|uniref:Uncharacterized protein n=1 Tax=Streptomyces corynorhini TaxID=2282652 RepID=A0A370B4J1_9ACTN|nr:hypothetical protein [Streptomyces corynorhini]RDG36730.1 hypothetical protein DVH02_18185 [Streptomyces corynorhini]